MKKTKSRLRKFADGGQVSDMPAPLRPLSSVLRRALAGIVPGVTRPAGPGLPYVNGSVPATTAPRRPAAYPSTVIGVRG